MLATFTFPNRILFGHGARSAIAEAPARLPPTVGGPPPAGPGSECGRGALIPPPQTGRKTIVLSPHLLPSLALCDPELTRGLPPVLTAGTGMDALTHCVESYLSTTFH